MTVEEILKLLEDHYSTNVGLEKFYYDEKKYDLADYARGAYLDLGLIIKEIREKIKK